MIYPGGWNAIEISEPKPIKPIIAQATADDGSVNEGTIENSSTYFAPVGSWSDSPLSLNLEPKVIAVNSGTFYDELYKADAMNGQTKMANLTDAPPPMENIIYVFGNKNGNLRYQMEIEISWSTVTFNDFELSVLENAATDGGALGVVQVYKFDKGSAFNSPITLRLMFDNFFGPVNLGIRVIDSAPAESIMALRCIVLDTESR
ncbi:hypothetical protein ACFLSQ_09310 [Bacteroidota bacterium]